MTLGFRPPFPSRRRKGFAHPRSARYRRRKHHQAKRREQEHASLGEEVRAHHRRAAVDLLQQSKRIVGFGRGAIFVICVLLSATQLIVECLMPLLSWLLLGGANRYRATCVLGIKIHYSCYFPFILFRFRFGLESL